MCGWILLRCLGNRSRCKVNALTTRAQCIPPPHGLVMSNLVNTYLTRITVMRPSEQNHAKRESCKNWQDQLPATLLCLCLLKSRRRDPVFSTLKRNASRSRSPTATSTMFSCPLLDRRQSHHSALLRRLHIDFALV